MPAEHLRSSVRSYADFDMAGWPPGRHRGLPGGTLPLVVGVGAPFTLRFAGRDLKATTLVAGLRTGPVDILHVGAERRTRSLAEAAAVCGYVDQAHMTNGWKRLAGCTPGEWRSEELPFLQDAGGRRRAW